MARKSKRIARQVGVQSTQSVVDEAGLKVYQAWQQRFLRKRLRFGLTLAIAAYLTFIVLRAVLSAVGQTPWDPSWFIMAGCTQLGLILCFAANQSNLGRRHPEWIFLGCSWSVTLIEQIWATLRGEAFTGLFAWTLVFLTQATLVPVRWRFHLVSQIGLLGYYMGVNQVLGLGDPAQPFWDATLWLYLFWFCSICNLSVFFYDRLKRSEFLTLRALEAERRTSERLLLNILPAVVARQLKQETRTIADHFAEVTVLFADIVGFTQMSSGIPPDEMVTLLNQIFSSFDHLAERHGLEKIKTIGDSYMVVGGLPLERKDHTEAIANMALDMQEAIATLNQQQDRPFNIRIGIHTGPVVAGVIGIKKFIYDLWGDTVNIASRMESHGLAGCIQVTETVYNKLSPHYHLQRRGQIYIKGKGDMTTYLLIKKRAGVLQP
jgi:adenylate cyclase